MPVYEYKCSRCSAVFEKLVRLSEEDELRCPVCDSAAVEKLVSKVSPLGEEDSSGWGSSCGTSRTSFG
ncbi:MAG: zinc ribbon domain-containing protein [Chloroflexi bacterium]|nr:zinc ribbon domain-containing protein [Chloroflexota bacterium]